MKTSMIILMAFFVCSICIGQNSINGKITKTDGKPAKGTMLQLNGSDSDIKIQPNGEFLFEDISDSDSLIVKIAGNKYFAIPIDNNQSSLQIVLEKDKAVVDNGITKQTFTYRKKIYKNSNFITEEDIKELRPLNFADIIRRVPGVRISHEGEVYLRKNFSPHYILDGSECTLDVIKSLNVYSIKSIEIRKTGAGFGQKGLHGVIIVETV